MTISITNSKDVLLCNGVIREFTYTFEYNPDFIDDYIEIYQTDDLGVITKITTNFTIDKINKKVIYPTIISGLPILPNGYKLTILRNLPLTQEITYSNQGAFPSKAIEGTEDKSVMLIQQMQEQLSRAVKQSVDKTEEIEVSNLIDEIIDLKNEAFGYRNEAETFRDETLEDRNDTETFRDESLEYKTEIESLLNNTDGFVKVRNLTQSAILSCPNGVINENKIYDFTNCSQLVSSGNNFVGRVSTNSSSQYIQKGYLNPQNNSFEFKFLVNRTGAGFSYICDTGNIIFSISNTEIKADMYLNGSETPTSLIITGTFATGEDYYIRLNFNGTSTYTLGYSTNGTTYTNNTLANSYKLNPTNLKILFGGWYGATRDTITPYFDGIYDFSETSLIIGGSYILENNNGNLAETGQNLEVLFPNGLNTDKTYKSFIAKRETSSTIYNPYTSEKTFYVLVQYISTTDLEIIILEKSLVSFETNEDLLDRTIKTETYFNFNKNTNQWKRKSDGSKNWEISNSSYLILGECFTDYRGVITHYNFDYQNYISDRYLTSRDLKNIAELDKDNNFTGNNNFENGEITAKTQAISDDSKKVATTEFVNNEIDTKDIGVIKEFAGSVALPGHLMCDGSAISRTTYARLFAVIGTTYGSGDGSTTFNIPDKRAAYGLGAGTSTKFTENETFTLGQVVNDRIQGHKHALNANIYGTTLSTGPAFAAGAADLTGISVQNPITDGTNGTPRTGNTTLVKSIVFNYMIKY